MRIAFLTLAALSLAGCDAAGTVIDDTARIAAVEQCTQLSEGAGIAAGAVNSVCNCAADKWLEKPVAERVQLDTATIQSIINECAGTGRKSETPASSETY
jgi:hypothetical protein